MIGRKSARRHGWPVALVGTILAFLLGYVFATHYPLPTNWYQHHLAPALNYACTGHFGPLRLADNATAEDRAGAEQVSAFLRIDRAELSCASFPRNVVATSVFDGFDFSNVDQPLYLTLSYGMLWRWFGPNWWLNHYLVATLVAVSFLLLYLSAQRFAPPLLAAGAILLFLSSPVFIRNVLSPRDALKFPFVVGITALLVGYATAPRRRLPFVAFAAGLGLLIGVGSGFRSDLMLFLLPGAFIIAVLGHLRIDAAKISRTRQAVTNVAVRGAAVAAFLVAFAAGAWLPLLNDYYLNEHNRNVPYHALAAGMYGITNYDLVQSHDSWNGMYMFRNLYNNDMGIGVRVLEYAARRYGDDTVKFGQERYWTYAKRYYLDVASRIPADMISGAVGAFINLMTVPASTQRSTLFDSSKPWSDTYSFARGTLFFTLFVQPMEAFYRSWRYFPQPLMLVLNLVGTYIFLCLIGVRYGMRAAVAAMVVLGTILGVVSLRFEMRHTFYIYAFSVVTWTSVTAFWLRHGPLLWDAVSRRRRGIAPARAFAVLRQRTARVRSFVAVLALAILAAVYIALSAARTYQADHLRASISDWLARPRVPVQFDAAKGDDGTSLVRIRSAVPTSTGGMRGPHDPIVDRIEMAVVAVELDGARCADRVISISGMTISIPEFPQRGVFELREPFAVRLRDRGRYLAFLPAFFERFDPYQMQFSGLEMATDDLACITGISAVSQFKTDDVLFDFFLPAEPERIHDDDLFRRVRIRRLGSF